MIFIDIHEIDITKHKQLCIYNSSFDTAFVLHEKLYENTQVNAI